MRITDNNSYMSVAYERKLNNKKTPNIKVKDTMFQDIANDETKKIKDVYYDYSEIDPRTYLGKAYLGLKAQSSAPDKENSITLTPGTTVSLGKYSGHSVIMHITDNSTSLSYGSNPIGSDYVALFNTTIRRMLNGTVDQNGIPDMSKLTREQNIELLNLEKNHEKTISELGGPEEYDSFNKVASAIDCLIRVANGQMPGAAISPDVHQDIKIGLEEMGIDTSKSFYVNGQKFIFSTGNVLNFAE